MGIPNRILIVGKGKRWFTRMVAYTMYDATRDEMVYHCDKPIGGPFKSLAIAVASVDKILKPKKKKKRVSNGAR